MFLHKSERGMRNKTGNSWSLLESSTHRPDSVPQDRFYTVDHLGQAWPSVVRNREMSAIQVFLLYIKRSEFSWYMKQCPLLGGGRIHYWDVCKWRVDCYQSRQCSQMKMTSPLADITAIQKNRYRKY